MVEKYDEENQKLYKILNLNISMKIDHCWTSKKTSEEKKSANNQVSLFSMESLLYKNKLIEGIVETIYQGIKNVVLNIFLCLILQ